MLEVRKARADEIDAVLDFYAKMIDDMQGTDFDVQWRHDGHPSKDFLREAVADGSIRTDYPEELGELLLLLANVWLNPMIYPATPEKTRRRMELYDQMLRSMGLDLLDQELLNQWERFCRLSQERL